MKLDPQVFTLGIAFAGLLGGCDYVGHPLEEGNIGGPGEGVTRRVLLEDFTGHTCPNCPAATAVALQLQALYGEENLIIVGLHVTDAFALPGAPPFQTDFRTPAGDTYADPANFNITFLPVGMVSRKEYNSSKLVSDGNWGSAVSDIIGQPADADLWFDSFNYDSGTGQITTTIKVVAIANIDGDHNVTIYLTEDHIIAGQVDNTQTPPIIPDYDHRHVLRDNLNGTWGELVIAGSANAGDTLTLSALRPLSSNVLEPDNCTLVAYLYKTTTDEILQVAEHKFVP